MQVGHVWNKVEQYWIHLDVSRCHHFSRTHRSNLLHSFHFKPRILSHLEVFSVCRKLDIRYVTPSRPWVLVCAGHLAPVSQDTGTRICEELRAERVVVWSCWALCWAFVVSEAQAKRCQVWSRMIAASRGWGKAGWFWGGKGSHRLNEGLHFVLRAGWPPRIFFLISENLSLIL